MLLQHLIEESLLLRDVRIDHNGARKESVHFSFQRLSDHVVAQALIAGFHSKVELKKACKKGGQLAEQLGDFYWSSRGVVDALAILIPEKYGMELFEVFRWKRTDKDFMARDQLDYAVLRSLKWRKVESIDEDKIIEWLQNKNLSFDYNQWLYCLLELTCVRGHPFNGDRFHQMMMRYTMPKRDGFWQQHMRGYCGEDDHGTSYPITRLIDWAWQQDVSHNTDFESARLVGQTLAWVLSTTNRSLRDQASKALVNLLQYQTGALLAILRAFEEVDDLYIHERLYAVTYGCALRTTDVGALRDIASYLYEVVFKSGNPPEHILIRDYTHNTIEYALHKGAIAGLDMDLVRPPYQSKLPRKYPSAAQIKKYDIDDPASNRSRSGRTYAQIHFSIMGWDFGRYTIDSTVRNFHPVSFTLDEEYRGFRKALKRDPLQILRLIQSMTQHLAQIENARISTRHSNSAKKARLDEDWLVVRKYRRSALQMFKKYASKAQYEFVRRVGVPHLESVHREKHHYLRGFNSLDIKRWIVEKAYSLGYDAELHGHYDSMVDSYSRHAENGRLERIGKKYQWIAFHQVLAILADNYYVGERFGGGKNEICQGGWHHLWVRDINPSYITLSIESDEEEDELGILEPEDNWWLDHPNRGEWQRPTSEWIGSTEDLPDPVNQVMRKDEGGKHWLYLHVNFNWKEPRRLGEDRYKTGYKDIWYRVHSFSCP